MDPQVQSRDYYGNSSSKNKSKKTYNQNNFNHGSYNYSHLNGPFPRGPYKKYSNQFPQNSYGQHRPNNYPSWSDFDGSISNTKGNFGQSHGKFENQQNQLNYAKGLKALYTKGYLSDKNSRSTNATTSSDSDSNSNVFSELSGFKIVQNGKTIHDETNEELDMPFNIDTDPTSNDKFAASLLTIAPSAKKISIPMFV
jgi:hypothetical protein